MIVTLLTKKDFANAGFEIIKALRLRGHDVEIISLQEPKFKAKGAKKLQPSQYKAAQKRCQQSDILHWVGDDPPANNFFGKFALPDKPIVLSTGGSRFRREGFSGFEAFPLSAYVADFKGCITPELCYQDFVWCPHAWSDFKNCFQPSDKFVITHIPSSTHVKGTEIIEAAIEILKQQRTDFTFRTYTQVEHSKSIELKQGSHIYIDQMVLPHYAMAGVEAMAYGIPLMSNCRNYGIEHPVIVPDEPTAENIAEKLNEWMNWDKLTELSKQTFEYCQQVHGRVGEMWEQIYTDVMKQEPIYVLVPAYKAANYIERLTKAFSKQTSQNFKLIFGVDGCEETLQAVQGHEHIYNPENRGAYAMLNDLLDLVPQTANYVFFGADDVPHVFMIEYLHRHRKHEVVQFFFTNTDSRRTTKSSSSRMIKKSLIDQIGKYEEWRCGCDTEMMYRMTAYNIDVTEIKESLFVRTINKDSLMNCKEYGTKSEYRKEIWNKIKQKWN